MQNCVTMQPMLINSSYTFRIMSYSGSDLVRSSVTGSSLGRSGKLTKRPIDGSRGSGQRSVQMRAKKLAHLTNCIALNGLNRDGTL